MTTKRQKISKLELNERILFYRVEKYEPSPCLADRYFFEWCLRMGVSIWGEMDMIGEALPIYTELVNITINPPRRWTMRGRQPMRLELETYVTARKEGDKITHVVYKFVVTRHL